VAWVAGLLLPSSTGSPSPTVNWRQVEDSVKWACSQVTATERLLQEALTMSGWDILHLIWISLKKKESLPKCP
jgi:hypothetical protein